MSAKVTSALVSEGYLASTGLNLVSAGPDSCRERTHSTARLVEGEHPNALCPQAAAYGGQNSQVCPAWRWQS